MWVHHGLVYLPKFAASRPGQYHAVFSSRDTGSVSFSGLTFDIVVLHVASGWYTTLRQVGRTNHPPSSLRLCNLQVQRDCKSLVQLYVARQPAVNKKQSNCIYHVVGLHKSGHVYSYGGITTCPVCSTHRSRFPSRKLIYVVRAHACCAVCRSQKSSINTTF